MQCQPPRGPFRPCRGILEWPKQQPGQTEICVRLRTARRNLQTERDHL